MRALQFRRCLGGPRTGTTVSSHPGGRIAGKRGNMLGWLITMGGLVVFGLVIFFWVHWTDVERELFSNSEWHHLE